MRVLLLVVMLAGCLDEEDDDCDASALQIDAQPADPIPYQYWIGATAVGGIQHLTAHTYDDCGNRQSASQITASSNAPAVIDATAVGTEEIELRAHQAGTASLIVNNTRGLRLTRMLEAKPIATVAVASLEEGTPQAFYPGKVALIELLAADGKPLVDRGLSVVGDIPRSAVWNELDLSGATPGDHSLEIIAGTSTWPATLSVVDGIDAVVAEHPTLTSSAYVSAEVCFFAQRAGQIVAGVPWKLTVADGDYDEPYIPNCIDVWADAGHTVTVTGTALGLTAVSRVTFTM